MGKFKAIALLIFILAIATPLGILAIQQYQATKAIVDARQQEELKEKLAELEKADQEKIEANKRARLKQEKKDRKKGIKDDEPNEDIRGLIMKMETMRRDDGSVIYFYSKPEDSGVFVQPYVIYRGGTSAEMRVFVCHKGREPVNFTGVELLVSEDKKVELKPKSEVKTVPDGDGIIQYFDDPVDKDTENTVRLMSFALGGKIFMPLPGPSNDDRYLNAWEIQRIKDMVDLYDILSGKKVTEDEEQ